MHFKRIELKKFRSFKGPLIDVRSPSEYYKGHMPLINQLRGVRLMDSILRHPAIAERHNNILYIEVFNKLKLIPEYVLNQLLNFEFSKNSGLNFFKTCNIQPAAQSSPSLSKISKSGGPRLKIFSTSDSIRVNEFILFL